MNHLVWMASFETGIHLSASHSSFSEDPRRKGLPIPQHNKLIIITNSFTKSNNDEVKKAKVTFIGCIK